MKEKKEIAKMQDINKEVWGQSEKINRESVWRGGGNERKMLSFKKITQASFIAC